MPKFVSFLAGVFGFTKIHEMSLLVAGFHKNPVLKNTEKKAIGKSESNPLPPKKISKKQMTSKMSNFHLSVFFSLGGTSTFARAVGESR